MLMQANGPPPTLERRTSFSQLVRAHHRWAKQLHGRNRIDEETRERYQTALAAFEETSGPIVDAYWCLEEASAVALTVREPEHAVADGFLGRLRRRPEPELRLHRVTDWATANAPPLADLLHSCDILAIKAGEGLEGTARRVAMQWVLAVESHVLGFVERSHADRSLDPKELQVFVASERAELEQIEAYINSSGDRVARVYYIQGMLMGILPLIALGFLAALLISLFDALDVHDEGIRAFYGCAVAGAAGAIVSVLSRMGSRKDNFAIDHEIPRRGLYALGSYRPFVGAIFGVAMYFLVSTPLLQIDQQSKTFAFYVTVAFLSGFSERWTRVILDGAQSVIGGKSHKPAATEADAPPVGGATESQRTVPVPPGLPPGEV